MKNKNLWLSQVNEGYSKQDSVIGPWCFEGNETVDPQWYQQKFNNPFENEDDLVHASKNALALFEALSENLSEELNHRHGLKHSNIFWRHVLAGWLSFLIHVSWARYCHIQKFIEQNKKTGFHVKCAPLNYDWNFSIAHDLIKNAPMPDFDYWLSSFIVQEISPDNWELEEDKEFEPEIKYAQYQYEEDIPLNNMRDIIRYPLRKVLYKYLRRSRFGNVYGTGWKERLLLSLYLSMKPVIKAPLKPLYQNKLIEGYNHSDYFPAEYLEILNKLIQRLMPLSLTDNFTTYYSVASKQKFRAGKIRVGIPDVYKEIEKLEAALAVEHGELVLQTQHGSWYGVVACSTVPQASEYGLYSFMTWGWDQHDDLKGNFIPAPSPMLSKGIKAHKDTTGSLLFVNNKTYTRSSRLEGQPMPAHTVRDRLDKSEFLNELNKDILDKVLYRPHMHHSLGIDDETFIREQFPDLSFLKSPSMNTQMENCRLFVANHYSTGFHIAMAANIPSVTFWTKGMCPIAETAQPEHQALIENGLVFDDPLKAARHINKIWDNVEQWWLSEEVQKARLDWCQKHAYSDHNYFKVWHSILSRIGKSL